MAVAARVATQRSEREIVLHWYSCNREKYYVKDATAGFLSQAANENPSTGMRECFKEEEERERGRIREKRSRARKDASLQRLRGLRLSWPGQLVTTTSNCIRMSESIYMPRMLFLVKSNPKQSHEVSSLTLCKLNFARLLFWPEWLGRVWRGRHDTHWLMDHTRPFGWICKRAARETMATNNIQWVPREEELFITEQNELLIKTPGANSQVQIRLWPFK